MCTETREQLRISVPVVLSDKSEYKFYEELETILRNSSDTVALECSQLTHVTSSHVNLLWQTKHKCDEANKELHLAFPTKSLLRVLQILDLDELFEYEHDDLPGQYSDEFGANSDSINVALDRFARFLSLADVPDVIKFELRTVFYEVATNIRTHSGLGENSPIHFIADPQTSGMTLTFEDEGPAFDPTTRAGELDLKRAARDGQKRGFGIVMIHKMVDKIDYDRRSNDTNVLTIHKNWSI